MKELILTSSKYLERINISHISNSSEKLAELFDVEIVDNIEDYIGKGCEREITNWNSEIIDVKGNPLNIFIYEDYFIPVVEYKCIVEFLTSFKEKTYNPRMGFYELLGENHYSMWFCVFVKDNINENRDKI